MTLYKAWQFNIQEIVYRKYREGEDIALFNTLVNKVLFTFIEYLLVGSLSSESISSTTNCYLQKG